MRRTPGGLRMTQPPDRAPTVLVTVRTSAPGKPQELSDTAMTAHASQRKKRFMAGSMRRLVGESSRGMVRLSRRWRHPHGA
jgi:hypothetical protein